MEGCATIEGASMPADGVQNVQAVKPSKRFERFERIEPYSITGLSTFAPEGSPFGRWGVTENCGIRV
jgi:hypothetical protein